MPDQARLTPPLPPGQFVDLPGRGRVWVRHQQGPPGAPTLLLLHGLGATADLNWFTAYAALAKSSSFVALDHRGHGRGIRSRRVFRLADCADDAAAVLDALGIERVIAVGYSMGGPIAQLLAHRHPAKVDGLVLCATSRDFRGHPRERAMFAALPAVSVAARLVPRAAWRSAGRRLVERDRLRGPYADWIAGEVRRTNPVAVIEAAAALGRFTSRDWIATLDVPAAVVVTTRDELVPPHRQRKLAEALPDARIFPVDGGHLVCTENPGRFVPALIAACRDVAERARARTVAAQTPRR